MGYLQKLMTVTTERKPVDARDTEEVAAFLPELR